MSTSIVIQETAQEAARRLTKYCQDNGYKLNNLYEYRDSAGITVYYRLRLDHPTNPKKIFPMHYHPTKGYQLSEPGAFSAGQKPLYDLFYLVQHPDAIVFVVEGEGVVDALNAFIALQGASSKYVAVTSGGATSASSADWSNLAGRIVRIWGDNDDPGKRYANVVVAILYELRCNVSILDISGLNLPEEGDCVDWLAANTQATIDDLLGIPVLKLEQQEHENLHLKDAEWTIPGSILAPLHPVPTFEAEILLPKPLCEWVMSEAERMSCPPDFIAVAAIVSLGSVIGARCGVRPKSQDPWIVIPNLWGAIVAPPSSKKSPAIARAFKPINTLAEKAVQQFDEEMEGYSVKKKQYEAMRRAHEKAIDKAAKTALNDGDHELQTALMRYQHFEQNALKEPTLRRYKTNDSTIEKIGELLQENPNGLLVERDEIVGLLSTWEKHGHEGDRAFYLESWNGTSSYNTDRITRGSISIPNLCLSVFGGIQPDKLIAYLEQAAYALSNDGMLQRFQCIVYPDPTPWKWSDSRPNDQLQEMVNKKFETLSEIDFGTLGASPGDCHSKHAFFRFDNEAQQIFIDWTSEINKVRIPQEPQPIIQEHLAKYDKLFSAIALILHLVDCVSSGQGGPITAESAYRAAAWCEYLEKHARRCYGLLIDDGLRSAQALAEKIQNGRLSEDFTARDISRHNWRYLTSENSVKSALEWLEEEGWVRSTETGGSGPGSGRPTRRYSINPHLKTIKQRSDENE